ncbi:MAG: hypothetical protein LCH79_08060 [Proteobacteria bacterium]|nr:hypothetical protein [Pseudomonadota bacterium]
MNLGELNTELWLFMLQSGDWWTPQELDRQFAFKPGTTWERLHSMVRHGSVAKRQVQGTRSVKFAVTATCRVPRGIAVGKVQVRYVLEEEQHA